jgi:ribosomal protein S1
MKEKNSKFAKLLEESFKKRKNLESGTKFEAKITAIYEDYLFIKIPSEDLQGVVLREEFIDYDIKIGDSINVYFLYESHGDYYFTFTLSAENANLENLELAQLREIPVWGQVATEISGGYEVKVGEFLGFCPYSQFDLEKKGKNLSGMNFRFIVNDIHPKTKKLSLSQKKFSDKEKELKKEILREELKVGQYVTCSIKSIHNFGLIVDLYGLDALIPVSEASFKKNPDLNQEYSVGQTLRAKILSIDWSENKFSLSLKESLEDPWSKSLPFKEGDIVTATVDSIKPFGLFVKFTDHFHGLVPSKETGLSSRTPLGTHFKPGEKVEVFITEVNIEKRQIAASILKAKETKEKLEYQAYLQTQNSATSTSSLGLALKKSLGKK